jgi:DNA-binding transcriptional MerR regulator
MTSLSYRIVNHWQNKGLLSDSRPEGKGWRMFSPMEYVWVCIITELRDFGVPIKTLQKVKEILSFLNEFFPNSPFPLLEFYSVNVILSGLDVYLIVFPNGDEEPINYGEYQTSDDKIGLRNHIKISLNKILQDLYPHMKITTIKRSSIKTSDEESKLFFLLRTGQYDSIEIKLKSGEIEKINATEFLKNDMRLTDIKKDADFQSIEFIQRYGKTDKIKRTINYKSKKS